MDWEDHCLLECGAIYSTGLGFAGLEAGEVNGKQSRSNQSQSVDGCKLSGKT